MSDENVEEIFNRLKREARQLIGEHLVSILTYTTKAFEEQVQFKNSFSAEFLKFIVEGNYSDEVKALATTLSAQNTRQRNDILAQFQREMGEQTRRLKLLIIDSVPAAELALDELPTIPSIHRRTIESMANVPVSEQLGVILRSFPHATATRDQLIKKCEEEIREVGALNMAFLQRYTEWSNRVHLQLGTYNEELRTRWKADLVKMMELAERIIGG